MSDLSWMLAPTVACLLVLAALGWFGLHVLQRGIIFVDLALAQIAALGTTYAVYLGHDPDTPMAFAMALAFTAVGSIAFSLLRAFEDRVPQEAIIGITYAVTAAAGVLLIELASDPHGAEKIQHLMVGNIVWVQWSEIGVAAGVIAVVAVVHAVLGRRFLDISFRPKEAERTIWLDLVFYMSFGLVLTSIVTIAGVLLVFSYLVIPAVIGRLFADGIGKRLAIAYGVAALTSLVGVSISYEHSTGPIVVTLLGGCLLVALVASAVRRSVQPGRLAAQMLAATTGLLVMLWGFARFEPAHGEGHGAELHDHAEHHEAEHHAEVEHHAEAAMLGATDPAEAEAPSDPLARLEAAVGRAKAGDAGGLTQMAALCAGDSPPFVRMEADDRLRQLAGEGAPAYDALAGPDEAGVWAAWAAAPPEGWQDKAAALSGL